MKRIIIVIIIGVLAAAFASAQNAVEIVERSRNRIQAQTTSTRSQMRITARNGNVSERVIDQYSKDNAQGNSRVLVVFQSPPSVAGTRFLTLENPGRANDQWIFLPELGRVRRIAGAEGSGSFMGSDFSYDDIASVDRRTDVDDHRFLREEVFNGHNCHVIESTPKDTGYQYSRMIQWIDRENYVSYQIELYDRNGNYVKLLEVQELREVQGRLAPIVTRMTSLAAGTFTTLNVVNLRYDDQIPETVFTINFLETGRP